MIIQNAIYKLKTYNGIFLYRDFIPLHSILCVIIHIMCYNRFYKRLITSQKKRGFTVDTLEIENSKIYHKELAP